MERVSVDGADLEVTVQGEGEAVLLVHGSIIADAFAPLLADPALAKRYRLISYHRRGYGGSSRADQPVSIAQQAADARMVLRHAGVDRAHIAGHSYGGVIALQLALDAPESVHSLALFEPGLLNVPSAEQFFAALQPVLDAYQARDAAGAIDAFARNVFEPDYRSALDAVLPTGWFEQAVADADTFFRIELPALQEWSFSQELAGRITQPVLAVLGAESVPIFVEIDELVRRWLPQAEPFVLPGATHALQMSNPRSMAEGLAGFFARHPVAVAA